MSVPDVEGYGHLMRAADGDLLGGPLGEGVGDSDALVAGEAEGAAEPVGVATTSRGGTSGRVKGGGEAPLAGSVASASMVAQTAPATSGCAAGISEGRSSWSCAPWACVSK